MKVLRKRFTSVDRPPSGATFEDFCHRLEWIKQKVGVEIDPEEKKWAHNLQGVIENPIGFVKVPLAVAGPLTVHGTYAKGEFLIPLATVEATLAMSLTRGAYICSLAGGIQTRHIHQKMSRAPVFQFKTLNEAAQFQQWVMEREEKIKEIANSTTRFGKLLGIDFQFLGSSIICDFIYTTQDAAGQNMTTIATAMACQWIREQFTTENAYNFLLESNYNGDKNPSHRSLIKGRGHAVTAEVTVPEKFLRRFGRTSAYKMHRGSTIGASASQLAGVSNYNLHTVNAIAGIYLATGQDVACVVENAMNTVQSEIDEEGNLKASIYIPSLTVGTVGGGTGLEDQNKNLQMMGCQGLNSSKIFAEIIAASCLALEFSLAAAVTSNEFKDSHEKYARGK